MPLIVCTPKILPPELEALARHRSIEINPANADVARTVERLAPGRRGGQRRLALVVGNRWPASKAKLSVQFLDTSSKALRTHILSHMNAWHKTANIRFEETQGTGEVRIARYKEPPDMAGYWSWLGTEILAIPEDEPTMNLEGFTMKTRESEFIRVVRHETGHTLGFDHEHMRSDLVAKIDRKKAIAYFKKTEKWTAEETDAQVLTPLKDKSLMSTTEADPLSIMCYQIPGDITKDGKPIPGGVDINEKDYAFAAKIYPKSEKKAKETTATEQADTAPAVVVTSNAAETDTFSIVIMDEFKPEAKAPSGAKETKLRFARVYASYAGAQVISRLQLRAGKGDKPTAFGRIIQMHERIKNYTNREKGTLPEGDDMTQFGSLLFDTLIQGDVLRLYDEARAKQQSRKLDVIVTSMIPWVAEKPWEFAFDTKRKSYLATEDVHMVRNVVTAIPAYITPPQLGPLRILVAAAQPVGMGQLSIDQEVEVIRRGFEALIEAGLITVDVLPRATPGRLHGKLSTGNYTVVHFVGHGTFDENLQQGALSFEDEEGSALQMGERSVREIFCKRGVNLVFLNACQSGSGGLKDFNLGVAQSLVSHGMPAVIANQYSVLDSSATSFAQHFYWALAQGMTIGQSACEARIAVNYAIQGEIIDWAVPVVYTRVPNLALCLKAGTPITTPAISVRRSRRRAIQDRKVRIAVWDIDSAFPSIEQTLDEMNSRQTVYGFELISQSLPINAWDLENRSRDKTPYLWAEKFARQVKRITADLRTDMLVCITRHWMRSDETLNIYSWWTSQKSQPVSLFSCAGFDELPPAGRLTDRVIANALVTVLAGNRAGLDSHTRGAKTCPFDYNAKRSLRHMAGFQKFDARCRAALARKMPTELPALESLLNTFH